MKNIKDYCVPHSIAMILNQKQFDEPCFAFYSEQKQLEACKMLPVEKREQCVKEAK